MDGGSSTLAAEAMRSLGAESCWNRPPIPLPQWKSVQDTGFPLQPLPRGKQACQDVPTCLKPSLFSHLNPGTGVPHTCCIGARNETGRRGDRCPKQSINQQSISSGDGQVLRRADAGWVQGCGDPTAEGPVAGRTNHVCNTILHFTRGLSLWKVCDAQA